MTERLKLYAIAFIAACICGCNITEAAVPMRWTVDASRAGTTHIDIYKGETATVDVDITNSGKPLEMAGAVALYIQTNGMDNAWWIYEATASSNRVSATIAPTNYPANAKSLTCFIGGPSTNFRAAFTARIIGAPGENPNTVEPPVQTIDFSNVTVFNAPWVKSSGGAVTNFRVVDDKIYFGQQPTEQGQGFIDYYIKFSDGDLKVKTQTGMSALVLTEENIYDVIGESMDWMSESIEDLQQTSESIPQLATSVTNLSNTVNAWQTYWDGDDVRLTVTNYYGSVDYPHLYLEQKVSEGGTNYFKRVWDETTRHETILSRVAAIETNVADKADRAWGFYDSHTGGYAPDGFTSISSQKIIVAPGMSYQKTVSVAGNAIWVLAYNDETTFSGVTSNGFFKVSDGEGNTLLEIVKGDKRTVGATAASIAVEGLTATIAYNVESDSPPALQYCTDLQVGEWNTVQVRQGAMMTNNPIVTWSGSSGAWTASIALRGTSTFPAPPATMFFKASYEAGGETFIKNGAPISVEGGILCTDGVHKVRPVYNNGSITWQVVQ